MRSTFFVPHSELGGLVDFIYKLTKVRLGDETLVLNRAKLAALVAPQPAAARKLREALPEWVALVGLAGTALFPEERLKVQEKEFRALVQEFRLKLCGGFAGVSRADVVRLIDGDSGDHPPKLAAKGACQDIFFLTTLDKAPGLIETVRSVAARFDYPWPDIGIYIQPQHQGVSQHVEFSFPYDPNDAKEVAKARDIYLEASAELVAQGAYFSRPYGYWADLVYSETPARPSSANRQADRRSHQRHESRKALLLGAGQNGEKERDHSRLSRRRDAVHPLRLLQMDSARPDEELAVFQGLPEHRVRKVPFLFGRRPAGHRAVADGRPLNGDRQGEGLGLHVQHVRVLRRQPARCAATTWSRCWRCANCAPTLVEDGMNCPKLSADAGVAAQELQHDGRAARASAAIGPKDLERQGPHQDTAKYVFHAGCRYSFDGEQSEVARTAVEILKKAGLDFGIMGAAGKLLRRQGV